LLVSSWILGPVVEVRLGTSVDVFAGVSVTVGMVWPGGAGDSVGAGVKVGAGVRLTIGVMVGGRSGVGLLFTTGLVGTGGGVGDGLSLIPSAVGSRSWQALRSRTHNPDKNINFRSHTAISFTT
jgi:hypothetical protein